MLYKTPTQPANTLFLSSIGLWGSVLAVVYKYRPHILNHPDRNEHMEDVPLAEHRFKRVVGLDTRKGVSRDRISRRQNTAGLPVS